MDIEMVLNELSHKAPASDRHVARDWMSTFVTTAVEATKHGVKSVLRTHDDLNLIQLAPDYLLAQWRTDPQVDIETRRFLRSLTTKAPFLEDVTDQRIRDYADLSEFRLQGESASGLGYACLLDCLSVSFLSSSQWDVSQLSLEVIELDESAELVVDPNPVTIHHAARREHVLEHQAWIQQRTRANVADGSDLWNRRTSRFPNLRFCESTREQLFGISSGDPLLRFVVRSLFELEAYASGWTQGSFAPDDIRCKVSPESEATIQQYSKERTFMCPDGEERLFSWHVKINYAAWRVYFYPEPAERVLFVGYIGHHLRTATDPR